MNVVIKWVLVGIAFYIAAIVVATLSYGDETCDAPYAGSERLRAIGVQTVTIPEPELLIRAYNAEPPESNIHPDLVVLLRRHDGRSVVIFVEHGCIVGYTPANPGVMRLIEGNGA